MVGVEEAVEHVRHAVGLREDRDEKVPVRPAELAERRGAHLVHGLVEVVQERLLVDALGVERRGVLRPADRLVGPERPGELARERARGADRGEGADRRIVERGEVDAERIDGEDMEAAEPVERDQREAEGRHHGDAEGEPGAPGAARDARLAAGEVDRHRVARPVHAQAEREGERRPAAAARIGRPGHVRARLVAGAPERHQPPAAGILRVRGEVVRQVEEGTVGAEEVRDAEAREHAPARHRVGREGVRHAQHDCVHAVLGRHLPEGHPAPARPSLGRGGLDDAVPVARRAHTARAHVGEVGRRVALDEVEDAVAARPRPGREGGPRHRRLRRVGRGERAVVAALGERAQVGQLPLLQPAREEARVDAVEAEDHEPRPAAPDLVPAPAAAPDRRQQGDRHPEDPQRTTPPGTPARAPWDRR